MLHLHGHASHQNKHGWSGLCCFTSRAAEGPRLWTGPRSAGNCSHAGSATFCFVFTTAVCFLRVCCFWPGVGYCIPSGAQYREMKSWLNFYPAAVPSAPRRSSGTGVTVMSSPRKQSPGQNIVGLSQLSRFVDIPRPPRAEDETCEHCLFPLVRPQGAGAEQFVAKQRLGAMPITSSPFLQHQFLFSVPLGTSGKGAGKSSYLGFQAEV